MASLETVPLHLLGDHLHHVQCHRPLIRGDLIENTEVRKNNQNPILALVNLTYTTHNLICRILHNSLMNVQCYCFDLKSATQTQIWHYYRKRISEMDNILMRHLDNVYSMWYMLLQSLSNIRTM